MTLFEYQMTKMKCLALSLLVSASAANAAYLDLTSFMNQNGIVQVDSEFVALTATPTIELDDFQIFGTNSDGYLAVSGLESFEYMTSGPGATTYMITMNDMGVVNLASHGTFSTHTFSTPYTGVLSFSAQSATDVSVILTLRNFAAAPLAPVPEPETYAMLLAGLALTGLVARRRKPSFQACQRA